MAAPTQTDLATLDFGYLDGAFAQIAAKSSIDLNTLDYAYKDGSLAGNAAAEAESTLRTLTLTGVGK